jgi:hypothetical protein
MSQFNAFAAVDFWPIVANGGIIDISNPVVVAMNNYNAGC